MKIKRFLITALACVFMSATVTAQVAPPSTGSAMASARSESVPVNNFTGIPSIGVPLFSYSHRNGISFNISLDYFAGGVKVNESPSAAGLGWNLNAGGAITRTVRGGVPDDCPNQGYMYRGVMPADTRSNHTLYYNECFDPEQDLFQFNFSGGSGKFLIGSDTSVFLTTLSKIKVRFVRTSSDSLVEVGSAVKATIQKFIITTEDGIKYIFEEPETQSMYVNTCAGFGSSISGSTKLEYSSAWYLTKIVSAFGGDTIKIAYATASNIPYKNYSQSVSVTGGVATHSDTSAYNNMSGFVGGTYAKVPLNITFPDARQVSFYYSGQGQFRHTSYPLLQRIKIMDSTLLYGYMLNWDTTGLGSNTRDFLTGINYFTKTAIKPGYKFTYNTPYFGLPKQTCSIGGYVCNPDTTDNFLNKKDHWGYYNGANNSRDYVPSIAGYTGADREANSLAVASTINSVQDPAGGITYYDFENNDVHPSAFTAQSFSFDAAANTQNNIIISRTEGKKTFVQITLTAGNSGSMPVTGSGNMVLSVTDNTGTIVYSTDTVNLKDLFYSGYATASFAVAPGNYVLRTSPASGTSSSIALTSILGWYNQAAASGTATLTGGLRIKQIRHFDPFTGKSDTLSTYKYAGEDGKSSGFINKKPVYDFYSIDGLTHYINSEVINNLDYSQGNAVGYKRVEVIKGTPARNLGKQVYEFTGIDEQDFDNSPSQFPYLPKVQRDWAFGLPKRILTYDNTGRLIQSQTNTFSYEVRAPQADSFYRSFRQPQLSTTRYFPNLNGSLYYPESGRANLTASADTFYHPDNSITTSFKQMEYDTNFNVKKIIAPYDLNKQLNIEQRMYYPYDYTVGGIIGALRDSGIFAPVSTESWITGDASPRMLSGTVTDFLRVGAFPAPKNPIKPAATYALQTNKPLLQSVIGSFNPAVLVRDTNYFVKQQKYAYSGSGLFLEAQNAVSGIKSATIYGYSNTRAVASISNAGYSDVAFTSFEPGSVGNWAVSSALRDTAAITGHYSYELSNGSITAAGLNTALTYLITWWTKGSATVSGGTTKLTLDQRLGWTLQSQKISSVSSVTVTGSGLVDELRLYPVDANMATTCFEPSGEINSVCDAGNNITYYEYDNVNRLRIIRNRDKNIIKKMDYSEIITTVSMTPDWQALDSTHWVCEKDTAYKNTGRVNRMEKDMNPYSETYLAEKYVYDHIDYARCPLPPVENPCGTAPDIKFLNGICEHACRENLSSIKQKVIENGQQVLRWVCTYRYVWSDNSASGNYTENNANPCPINSCSVIEP